MSSVAVPVSASLPRPSAAELRRLVESELADRIPGALSPRERLLPEMASTGIAALDELSGGWPRGTLSELFGPASSGRTSVLVAAVAAATARGEACALVDAGDAFDPESAAAAGVDLKRLLWIRCGKSSPQRREGAEKNDGKWQKANGKNRSVSRRLRCEELPTPEPRDIGIWGYGDTETMERIAPHLARKNPPQRRRGTEKNNGKWQMANGKNFSASLRLRVEAPRPSHSVTKYRTAYARIEQALKAADLLLGAGGFGLVVIDLAGLPPEAARRVPLTTWFRFRRAVEATSTVLLVVSPQPITQSCAALSVKLQQSAVSPQPSAKTFSDCHHEGAIALEGSGFDQFRSSGVRQFGSVSHAALLTGLRLRAEVVRSPLSGRKRPQSAHAEIETEARWA